MTETLNKVDEMLANRRSCIEALEAAAQRAHEARTAYTRAEEELSSAYAVASNTGWSSKELELLGFAAPADRQPTRKRAARHHPRKVASGAISTTPPPDQEPGE